MKDARIFDIQHFSLHDGPGIRTLIFFKGCSLACRWCANPEGISPEPEIKQSVRLCVGCGRCAERCPHGAIRLADGAVTLDRAKCRRCGACVKVCPTGALSWWGEARSVEELAALARRDAPFYAASGGGITLGGGEPLLQNEQAAALLRRCKEEGLNTAIETAGNYPWEYLANVVPYCDTIHFDVKGWRGPVCLAWFGCDNTRILENLRRLDETIRGQAARPRLVVRTPLLPGENFTPEDFVSLGDFLAALKALDQVELLPFHNLGEGKYGQLGKPYTLKGRGNLHAGDVEEYRRILAEKGLPVTVSTL